VTSASGFTQKSTRRSGRKTHSATGKPAPQCQRAGLPRYMQGEGRSADQGAYVRSLGEGGQPLDPLTRGFFEPRFRRNFQAVRVHDDGSAAYSARGINARAYTSGRHIVFGEGQYSPDSDAGKELLAHELTHVVQQTGATPAATSTVQRRVMMNTAVAGGTARWLDKPRRERRRLVRARFTNRAERRLAFRVMEDLASASDRFWFSNDDELYADVRKRVLTSRIMQATQRTLGGRRGFGYPFTSPSLYWGPRVNYAARNYWTPTTPDSYSTRRDAVRRRQIRRMPRNRRHSVYGDQPGGYR
jgi:hypothetical protein